MKLFFLEVSKLYCLNSCKRLSVFVSVFLYVGFFIIVKVSEFPLKSREKRDEWEINVQKRPGSIIEYLHKLHNLKEIEGTVEEEYEKIQPLYDLEEIFRK